MTCGSGSCELTPSRSRVKIRSLPLPSTGAGERSLLGPKARAREHPVTRGQSSKWANILMPSCGGVGGEELKVKNLRVRLCAGATSSSLF
ncbi:hypothetical protein EUGRSUZ_G03031 [Eucalyptus grandis]|uniref:Uncharacterized protein n=2 Tax=Eucalyptus grandis TaxID=71139 RepID=A0ACC3KAN0_EUCGR|nr:hypothetical protein EUGRSUZ_G03031 [Eucalyptus grandis]